MTWTYTGDPADSDKDLVRFLTGDTDTDDQLLTDEEVQYLVDNCGKVYLAASRAASAIAAKFSRLADKSVGDLRISLSQKVTHYRQLAMELAAQAGATAVTEDQGDPLFKKGMMEQCTTEEEDEEETEDDPVWSVTF